MRLCVLVVCLAVKSLVAQSDTLTSDPVPDRLLLLTTARPLPTGAGHFAVMGTLTSAIWSRGLTDRVTLTVGSPAWTVFARLLLAGWNVKVVPVNRPGLALAVGSVGVAAVTLDAAESSSWMVHWPYASATMESGGLAGTVNLGFGFGESATARPLGRVVAQVGLAARVGAQASLMGEYTDLAGSYDVMTVGIRLWDRRYFMDMGGVFNTAAARPLPWITIGGQL